MTTMNVSDTSRSNGHDKDAKDQTPEEIQLEIARTKSAIAEDLRVLSERFSPQQIRENAREVMRDAREEANTLIREAKEATIGSLIGAKDRAVETVKETVSEKVHQIGEQARAIGDQALVLGDRAKQASNLAVRYMGANPLMFSLIGVGAGWLLMALRNYRRSQSSAGDYDYAYAVGPGRAGNYASTYRNDELPRNERVRSVGNAATHAVDRAREEARSALDAGRTYSRDTYASSERLARRTGTTLRDAARRGGAVASDNKIAVVALTVAAGLGLSLLLPVGRRPRRALLTAGERAWDEAQSRAHQLRERFQTERRQPAY